MNDRSRNVAVLVTDLDNTLFDWFEFWYESFTAMIAEVERISGVDRNQLYADAHEVHQRHGTSEYSFLIQEMRTLIALHPNGEFRRIYDDAIHAFRSARKRTLRLYPTVMDTLMEIKRRGTLIVAYTESM